MVVVVIGVINLSLKVLLLYLCIIHICVYLLVRNHFSAIFATNHSHKDAAWKGTI